LAKSKESRPVYSTDGGRLCHQCHRPIGSCVCKHSAPADLGDGVVRIRRESKGRGGKTVTVIDGVPLAPTELKNLTKRLKQRCGVGGAVKEGRIEIQGDQREACRTVLEGDGFRVKLAGG